MSAVIADAAQSSGTAPGPLGRALAWGRRHPVGSLLAIGVLTRLVAATAALVAGLALPPYGENAWQRGPLLVRYLARWDSGYYIGIAEHGRGYQAETWAFEPGYPLAIRLVHGALPFVDVVVAGVLVSLAASFVAIPLFYALTRDHFGDAVAWRATALLALLPNAFYLSAVYADSLFLALVVAFFLAVSRRWWLLAGAAASVAAVTRPPGVLLPAVLALAVLLAWARASKRPGWTAFASLPLAAALPVWSTIHLALATGDPFIQHHMRETYWPLVEWHVPLVSALWSGPVGFRPFIFLAFGVLVGAMAWAARDAARRRLDAPLAVYGFAAVLAVVYLAYSDAVPIVRYLLPILPVPWALASLARTPARFAALAAAALAGQVAVAVLFAVWYPLY